MIDLCNLLHNDSLGLNEQLGYRNDGVSVGPNQLYNSKICVRLLRLKEFCVHTCTLCVTGRVDWLLVGVPHRAQVKGNLVLLHLFTTSVIL